MEKSDETNNKDSLVGTVVTVVVSDVVVSVVAANISSLLQRVIIRARVQCSANRSNCQYSCVDASTLLVSSSLLLIVQNYELSLWHAP
jgi:hypothetical protein